MFKWLCNKKGFTLIEMMVALIIIAVLIGGGITFYLQYIEKAKITKAKAQISTMQAALELHYAEKGEYPKGDDGDALTSALLDAGLKVSSASSGTKAELDNKDPWGSDNYIYEVVSTGDPIYYVVYTGKNNVQDKNDNYVVGEGKEGEVISLEVTKDIDPDGS